MVRHLTTEVREIIIRHSEHGHTQTDIASQVGVTQSAISKVLIHYATITNVAAGRSTGHHRLTTDRDDQILIRMVNDNRLTSAASLPNPGRIIWISPFPDVLLIGG